MSQQNEPQYADNCDEESGLTSPTESFYTARTSNESPDKFPHSSSASRSERADSFHTARTRNSESPKKRPELVAPDESSQELQDWSQPCATVGSRVSSDVPDEIGFELAGDQSSGMVDDASQKLELEGWNDTRRILLAKTLKQMKHSVFDVNDPTRPEYVALHNLIRGLKPCTLIDVAAAVTACKELYPDVADTSDRFFDLFHGRAFESLYKAIRYRTIMKDFRPSDVMCNMYKSLITAYCIAFREKGAGYDYDRAERRDDALGDCLIVAKWIVLEPRRVVESLRSK